MAFACPDCGGAGTLTIRRSMVLPPDSRSDDIIFQIVRCGSCDLRGAAVYEESRRGRLDSESWSHMGYRLDGEQLAELDKLVRRCPAKKNKRCRCDGHRALGRTDKSGRWLQPESLHWRQAFAMRRR